MNWYVDVLRKYAVFEGRARRKEYWMFCLFNIIASCAFLTVDVMTGMFNRAVGMGVFSALYSLAVIVPSLAVSVRRLHDTDRSGWWLLIALVPCLGAIVLLVYTVQGGTPGQNRFGSDPKAAA